MKNKKKTIVQIFARDFQEAPRIVQMCRDLDKNNFNVIRLLYGKRKETKKYTENFETIIIKKKGKLNSQPSNEISFKDIIDFGLQGSKKLKMINAHNKIDILHCHRHSALIPAFIAKLRGVNGKIVLDYHDPWSGESTIGLNEKISLSKRIKIKIFHLFERISLHFINHIVIVSAPQKKLLSKKYNIKDSKFTMITNSAAIANAKFFNPNNKNKKRFGWQGKKVVLFTGCIVPYFGVDLLIDSVPLVLKKVPKALFIIKIAEEIKEKEFYNNLLKKINKDHTTKNIIFIEDWFSEEKYASFVCSTDIGIICHKPTLLTKTADPDKLYEYLSAGLPIVATDLEIMKRYIQHGKNGFIVKHNANDISNALIKILNNKKMQEKMGQNSYNMRFDWKDDFEKLLKTYNLLLGIN